MRKHRLQMQRRPQPPVEPKPPKAAPADVAVDRINQYTCWSCRAVITTVDRNTGVTPAMIACRVTEGCDGTMHSHRYTVDQALTPDWEWYKPAKLPKGEMRQHVEMGGLLLRKIEAK